MMTTGGRDLAHPQGMEPTTPTTGTATDAGVRKLYRSRSERQLGGVAGGMARYTNTDPTLVRVLFVVLAVMGPGLLLYPLLWLVVPEEPGMMDPVMPQPSPS